MASRVPLPVSLTVIAASAPHYYARYDMDPERAYA